MAAHGVIVDRQAAVMSCPHCGFPVYLTLGDPVPQPDGELAYDGTVAKVGVRIHLLTCEARTP